MLRVRVHNTPKTNFNLKTDREIRYILEDAETLIEQAQAELDERMFGIPHKSETSNDVSRI